MIECFNNIKLKCFYKIVTKINHLAQVDEIEKKGRNIAHIPERIRHVINQARENQRKLTQIETERKTELRRISNPNFLFSKKKEMTSLSRSMVLQRRKC